MLAPILGARLAGGVFISYRREDSAGFAGRIYDRLVTRLPRDAVFIDVDDIPLGVDFEKVLSERVGACDALVAIIGREWINVAEGGRRRIDNPNDFVRIEIEAALERDVHVIPVLVDGARMPSADELPDRLKPLARRNGIEVSHTRFDMDAERLMRGLEHILTQRAKSIEEAAERAEANAAQRRRAETDERKAARSVAKTEASKAGFAGLESNRFIPRVVVCGVGGYGCNAINNMIASGLSGVDFLVANTDAQALTSSRAERVVLMGLQTTEGLGAGSQPEIGRAAAKDARKELREHLSGAHMCIIAAAMGGGTGTGATPVIAEMAREMGILTVGVVTKPFRFEGQRRLSNAEAGIAELSKCLDTLIVIPNESLLRIATEKMTVADASAIVDQLLFSSVAAVTDLIVKDGLINIDFVDMRSIMRNMGMAIVATGEASGERRAILAAEAAIANPLFEGFSMKSARGGLISIVGGDDLMIVDVFKVQRRIHEEFHEDARILLGAITQPSLTGVMRVTIIATGIKPDVSWHRTEI
jgi:cell division protein FtsZ